jgi:hypothetical protein
LVAVNVYVVVEAGEQVALPDAGTDGAPGITDMDVAPVTLQLNVELPPAVIPVGLAVNELITGTETGAAATVTVTCRVTEPAELVAVNVYVVVAAGEQVALPDAGTDGAPGITDMDVAPVTLQLNVELPPAVILTGLAVKELITGTETGAAATVTVTCRVTEPAIFVAVSV